MNKEYTKIDESTLSVVETKPQVLESKNYDYSFLKQQLVNIQAQKDRDNELRDAEILEVQTLIAEAEKLGITEKTSENAEESLSAKLVK